MGHSWTCSVSEAVAFAELTKVRRLILYTTTHPIAMRCLTS